MELNVFKLSWDSHEKHSRSVSEVDAILDALHTECAKGEPTLVNVERVESGDSLSIGLGRAYTVLNYVRGDLDPPYYTSTGGTDGNKFVAFRFGGEWSEYPSKNAIPIHKGRAAVRLFCQSGELDSSVEWEEV